MNNSHEFDCIVCGSCVADVLVRPFPLNAPIEGGRLYEVGPLQLESGGLVSNSGATLARLGLKTQAFSFLGDDDFGAMLRNRLLKLGIGVEGLVNHPTEPTSASVVLIDPQGERTFAHCVGAPRELDAAWFEQHIDFFARSRAVMIGYYSLMPNLDNELVRLMRLLRAAGCLTIIETAGEGGSLEPLAAALPEIDVYIPSYDEALHQTGESNPKKMLEIYRSHGAKRVIGVKLGAEGALISPQPGELITVACAQPPGTIVDTTGAGDAFLAGYVAGLLRGLSPAECGQLAAAAGACCVTGIGATAGLRSFRETADLAGLSSSARQTFEQSAQPNLS